MLRKRLQQLPLPTESPDFTALLEDARRGSRSGFGRMMESLRPGLMQLAEQNLNQQIRRRMSSSDVVQDTMLTAGRQFASFRGTHPGEFQQWVLEIFHSRMVDGIRRHQRAEIRCMDREEDAHLSGLVQQRSTPSAVVSEREEAIQLMRALQKLPPELQTIIQLRYQENQPFEKIAETLGTSVTTVWRRFQEATQAIHASLQ